MHLGERAVTLYSDKKKSLIINITYSNNSGHNCFDCFGLVWFGLTRQKRQRKQKRKISEELRSEAE